MAYKPYSKQETAIIFRMYKEHYSVSQIQAALAAKGFKRTLTGIKSHLSHKGIKRNKGYYAKYTPQIIQYLRDNYQHLSNVELAEEATKMHPKSEVSFNNNGICMKLQELGLKRKARINHGSFPKGKIPWNKGIHYNAPGRSRETRFKKGCKPHNTRKVGDIYLRTAGGSNSSQVYYYKPAKGKPVIPLHKWNWLQEHGEIPKGFVIAFKDGNPLNIQLGDCSNLECISRAELAQRNADYEKIARTKRIKKAQRQNQETTTNNSTGSSGILDAYLQGIRFN